MNNFALFLSFCFAVLFTPVDSFSFRSYIRNKRSTKTNLKLDIMGAKASTQVYDDTLYTTDVPGVTFEERIIEINGQKRNTAKWVPTGKQPKALVLVSHGLHEHCLRYWKFAHALNANGFVVMGIDHVAHGLSDGVKGLIPDFHTLENDFASFAESSHAQYPNIPCYLFSHSMGTLVGSLALQQLPFVKAVVFSGCPLFAGYATSSPFGVRALYPITQTDFAVTLTKFLAFLDPKGAAAPILLDALCSDEEEKAMLLKDRRRYEGYIMNKTAFELLKMIAAVKVVLPKITVPFMCIHGSEDMAALPMGSEYLITHTSTTHDHKSINILPGLKHEPFHEDLATRTKAIQSVVTYFENQLAQNK